VLPRDRSERPHAPIVRTRAQERPGLDGHDARFARPLLRELAPPVDEIVEQRAIVRTQPRERHLVLRRHEHVHVVDLQQAELADDAAQRRQADAAPGTGSIEALCSEHDAPCLGLRQLRSGMRLLHGRTPSSSSERYSSLASR
jgi:hypothetical protein